MNIECPRRAYLRMTTEPGTGPELSPADVSRLIATVGVAEATPWMLRLSDNSIIIPVGTGRAFVVTSC
jgi:hypothetical protein